MNHYSDCECYDMLCENCQWVIDNQAKELTEAKKSLAEKDIVIELIANELLKFCQSVPMLCSVNLRSTREIIDHFTAKAKEVKG